MCGIAGIIVKNNGAFNVVEKTAILSETIKHRGPDGEGFLIANKTKSTPCHSHFKPNLSTDGIPYLPKTDINELKADDSITLTFAHRRLSIIDLTATGHQPLCDHSQSYWITYNGEIYNYIELRQELKSLGFKFISESDTEVILAAYAAWGKQCVERFNGMWAFCIYDIKKQICFASRDRLGVKPFYYIHNQNCFAFASEQKAFIKAGLIKAKANAKAIENYIVNSLIETETSNFFENIFELWPGHHLIYDLKTHDFKIEEYYNLKNHSNLNNNHFKDKDLIEKIKSLLERSIQLRLRSDVEVGTCLSGGIDSSLIAAIIAANTKNSVFCFTSVFRNKSINEEFYADLVNKKINSNAYKIEPSLEGFLKEVDELIYSQDAPIWNTSTYAQYKVMELAKQNGIKVVLDGQGADELFAGYHHHYLAKWQNLWNHNQKAVTLSEISNASKTISNPFLFFAKEKIKEYYDVNKKDLSQILNPDFINHSKNINSKDKLQSVNEVLINDIYNTRLKTFLKCEDRCGMWHSVESRTPFSDDIDLINFLFSFDGNRKIQKGISKYLLREAGKSYLPNEIYTRYDKVGFETPMQDWMKKIHSQMIEEIKSSNFDFVKSQQLSLSNSDNEFQNKLLFKLFVLSKWQKVFA